MEMMGVGYTEALAVPLDVALRHFQYKKVQRQAQEYIDNETKET